MKDMHKIEAELQALREWCAEHHPCLPQAVVDQNVDELRDRLRAVPHTVNAICMELAPARSESIS